MVLGNSDEAHDSLGNDMRGPPDALQRGRDSSLLPNREDYDGNFVLASQRESCCIHNSEILRDGLVMGQGLVSSRRRIPLWIGGINAINLCRLQNRVGGKFGGTQRGSRVRGEKWVSGAPSGDHYPALGQMVQRRSPRVGFT